MWFLWWLQGAPRAGRIHISQGNGIDEQGTGRNRMVTGMISLYLEQLMEFNYCVGIDLALDDLHSTTGSDCWCAPVVIEVLDRIQVILHNSKGVMQPPVSVIRQLIQDILEYPPNQLN